MRRISDLGQLRALLTKHWRWTLALCLLVAHLSVIARVLLLPGRPPLREDSAIFEYAGWFIAGGGSMYTGLWEAKLPLPYQTTAVTALLSGGNAMVHHLVNVLITVAASVLSGVLVADLASDLTERRSSAFLGGLSMLILPGYFYLPAFGFKSKFFVVFTGLLAIWLTRRRFYALGGAAAAASVGYYQLAAIYPVIVLALAYQRGNFRGATRTALGGLALALVMVLPILFVGAFEAMITETLVIHLVVTESAKGIPYRVLLGGYHFGIAFPLVIGGGYGLWLVVDEYDYRDTWWVLVGAAWFAFVVFFLDYDNFPDLIPGLVFVAIGLAVLADGLRGERRRWVTAAIAVVVIVNVVAVTGFGFFGIYPITPAEPLEELESQTYRIQGEEMERPNVRYLYWTQTETDTCHVRLSATELGWLALTDKPFFDTDCGNLRLALGLL
ncbi:MAG: DolP-mannose mannosyltransferase [Haloarculaceae archaeon]